MTARVHRLSIAPVKGLALVDREEVGIGPDGVSEDRLLYLRDAKGAVVTLRRHPELGSVVPDLDLAARRLSLQFADGRTVTGSLDELGVEVTSRLYGRDRPGRVVRGPLAEALSAYAAEPLELVLHDRLGLGWDEGPVSLVSCASMLAATPADVGATAHHRFRMLIEVDGLDAYAEDQWADHVIRVGEVELTGGRALGRCTVPDHHPRTGVRDWQTVRSLLDGRGTSTLGLVCSVARPGTVRLGDPVTALSEEPRAAASP